MITLQDAVDIAGGFIDGSISNYTFTYNDGSESAPTFAVLSNDCNTDSVTCEHVFNIPSSSVPLFYSLSVTATNVVGEGPATTSLPIREWADSRLHVIELWSVSYERHGDEKRFSTE